MDTKDLKTKIHICSKTIESDHENYDAYNKRGAYKILIKDYPGALRDCMKAIMIKPDFAKGYYNIGLAYHDMHQPYMAIPYYDKALNLNPRFAEAYCNRGIEKARFEDYEGAISDFNKSINIKPELTIAFFNKINVKRKMNGENVE